MHILADHNFKLCSSQMSNSPSSVCDKLTVGEGIKLSNLIVYCKMLQGQLNMLSSLSQPRAEPGLLLLFEVVCVCAGVGEVELLLEATCPTSRCCLLFLFSLLSGAGRAWPSSPLVLSNSSERHGRSPVSPSSSPSFLGAAGLRATWPFKDPRRAKCGAPHRIQEIPRT